MDQSPDLHRNLNFMPRFADAITSGRKTSTVRTHSGLQPGDRVDFYAGWVRLLSNVQIVAVQGVRIGGDGEIRVAGARLDAQAADNFARTDGFRGRAEMVDWIARSYGLPFRGVVINWAAPKPEGEIGNFGQNPRSSRRTT